MNATENFPARRAGKKTSRRSFIKNISLVAGGFFIVPRHVLGRGFIAPSDKLNIAGIGCGGKANGDNVYPGRKKLLWDGISMKITNFDPANQFVKRNYRGSWKLAF